MEKKAGKGTKSQNSTPLSFLFVLLFNFFLSFTIPPENRIFLLKNNKLMESQLGYEFQKRLTTSGAFSERFYEGLQRMQG
jgi:hypothetical protein